MPPRSDAYLGSVRFLQTRRQEHFDFFSGMHQTLALKRSERMLRIFEVPERVLARGLKATKSNTLSRNARQHWKKTSFFFFRGSEASMVMLFFFLPMVKTLIHCFCPGDSKKLQPFRSVTSRSGNTPRKEGCHNCGVFSFQSPPKGAGKMVPRENCRKVSKTF